MGDRGRVVVPAELRSDLGWDVGTVLHLISDESGVRILTQQQLLDEVRADLAGFDLVGELIADRRAEAARDLAEAEAVAEQTRGA